MAHTANRIMEKFIHGVILIDTWTTTNAEINSWYNQLKHNIASVSYNPYYVNACYNNRWNYNTGDRHCDVSQYNTLRLYHGLDDRARTQPTLPTPNPNIVPRIMDAFRGMNTTCITITELFRRDNAICLLDAEDFYFHCANYLDHSGHYRNWLIAGLHWKQCVHHRPMGLYKLISHNPGDFCFYGAPWSFLNKHNHTITHDDFAKDKLSWKKVTEDLYTIDA